VLPIASASRPVFAHQYVGRDVAGEGGPDAGVLAEFREVLFHALVEALLLERLDNRLILRFAALVAIDLIRLPSFGITLERCRDVLIGNIERGIS
jgi:hypothetical protein